MKRTKKRPQAAVAAAEARVEKQVKRSARDIMGELMRQKIAPRDML